MCDSSKWVHTFQGAAFIDWPLSIARKEDMLPEQAILVMLIHKARIGSQSRFDPTRKDKMISIDLITQLRRKFHEWETFGPGFTHV